MTARALGVDLHVIISQLQWCPQSHPTKPNLQAYKHFKQNPFLIDVAKWKKSSCSGSCSSSDAHFHQCQLGVLRPAMDKSATSSPRVNYLLLVLTVNSLNRKCLKHSSDFKLGLGREVSPTLSHCIWILHVAQTRSNRCQSNCLVVKSKRWSMPSLCVWVVCLNQVLLGGHGLLHSHLKRQRNLSKVKTYQEVPKTCFGCFLEGVTSMDEAVWAWAIKKMVYGNHNVLW